ncbi:YrhK family protein [Roseovarius pelagicus]|uniref:YrhK family protein n=1 Tax=Roseovarius pelagicus TaxID=2980108 RepID=A0ABY6DEU0_9RHOB|nr:YrhK family protein [Roseovarius pelagicus]UXX84672.1 YrhK family protein [Roseovarius pelagicus]
MNLFRHENRQQSADSRRIYALYEVAYTIVDFTAAISFLIGSILFFWAEYETAAIWLFIIGSACFCLKPTIRMAREVKLLRMGDTETLADRYKP